MEEFRCSEDVGAVVAESIGSLVVLTDLVFSSLYSKQREDSAS